MTRGLTLLRQLYTNRDPFWCENELRGFLQEAEEAEVEFFLISLCPGSVLDTTSLLLVWQVVHVSFPDHPRCPEIEAVLVSRLSSHPLEAACRILRWNR